MRNSTIQQYNRDTQYRPRSDTLPNTIKHVHTHAHTHTSRSILCALKPVVSGLEPMPFGMRAVFNACWSLRAHLGVVSFQKKTVGPQARVNNGSTNQDSGTIGESKSEKTATHTHTHTYGRTNNTRNAQNNLSPELSTQSRQPVKP